MRAACGQAIMDSEFEYDGVMFTRPDVMYESDVLIPTAWADNFTMHIPYPSGYRCSDGFRSFNAPLATSADPDNTIDFQFRSGG